MKLLALDVDGTTLRRDGTVTTADRAALSRLRERGVPVAFVTGRLWSGTRDLARDLGIDGPMGCIDGSHVVTVDGRDLERRNIAPVMAERVRDVLARRGVALFLLDADRITYDPRGARWAPYVSIWSPHLRVVEDHAVHADWRQPTGVLGVVGVGLREPLEEAARELESELGPGLSVIVFASPGVDGHIAMCVRAGGGEPPTKGTAIARLAAHHGCDARDVVAVGDWWNDVPMFRAAGRSFAMGGAPDGVAAEATDRLEARVGEGGGIAEVVRRVWG